MMFKGTGSSKEKAHAPLEKGPQTFTLFEPRHLTCGFYVKVVYGMSLTTCRPFMKIPVVCAQAQKNLTLGAAIYSPKLYRIAAVNINGSQ